MLAKGAVDADVQTEARPPSRHATKPPAMALLCNMGHREAGEQAAEQKHRAALAEGTPRAATSPPDAPQPPQGMTQIPHIHKFQA